MLSKFSQTGLLYLYREKEFNSLIDLNLYNEQVHRTVNQIDQNDDDDDRLAVVCCSAPQAGFASGFLP